MYKERTIAGTASSGAGSSISVIRISGPESLHYVKNIFRGVNGRKIDDILPFSIRYGHIMDGETPVDEVLVSYFRGPRSYTGEDVVEISCHGGFLPVRKILELVLREGGHMAEPGEFTKRAFLNGRIDLSQAEAVMDIINSRTGAALKAAGDQSRGKLSEKIAGLRDRLLNILASIEVTLDFPDDELERSSDLKIKEDIESMSYDINHLIKSSESGKIVREGLKVVIAGKPNVGKSSLLNALIEEDKAIVTDIPGTTRDVLEEYINIDGIPVKILDTAGIRKTEDPVEKIGVEKSLSSMEEADLVILVLDLSRELSHEDSELLSKTEDFKRIILLNKSDLERKLMTEGEIFKDAVLISAKNSYGLDEVRKKIKELSGTFSEDLSEIMITHERHRDALIKAENSLREAAGAIENSVPMDLVTLDINSAWSYLGEITGDTLREDIVDRIFSGFCIGK